MSTISKLAKPPFRYYKESMKIFAQGDEGEEVCVLRVEGGPYLVEKGMTVDAAFEERDKFAEMLLTMLNSTEFRDRWS